MQVIAILAFLGVASAGLLQPAAVSYNSAVVSSGPAYSYAAAPAYNYQVAAPVYAQAPVAYATKTFAAAPVAYAAPAPLAVAAPIAYAAPAPIIKSVVAPVAVRTIEPEPFDPNPQYNYGYSVSDSLSGDNKNAQETRNGDLVQGSYSLVEPDGAIRTVTYTADSINGFNAVVDRQAPQTIVKTVAAPIAVARAVAPVAYAAPAPIAYAAPAPVAYAAPAAYGYQVAAPVAYAAKTFAAPAVAAPVAYAAYGAAPIRKAFF